jgi:hypothetical protein
MQLIIRMNANTDEVVINGHTFDRSPLSKREKATMAAMVRDTLVADGTIKDRSFKSRRERRHGPRRGRRRQRQQR